MRSNAMAKRVVEYYPMIKDRSSSSNTEWWSMLQLCSEPCLLFPSSTMPPRKLAQTAKALFHVIRFRLSLLCSRKRLWLQPTPDCFSGTWPRQSGLGSCQATCGQE
ncbi:hypothetical protein AAFF_G00231280 [Aldrovandia affinis]|uniref:Uncharacterized protein n=1 Tax=Aldrovandia affinis TaxID=143900 RepID=A0AAD7RFD2_9TELE|nr:hypothetical protein AAFF_G00231280 [Aldrovandia affinis]